MKGFFYELRNHPAQATYRDPKTGESIPLWDNVGRPVPLVKDQHGVYVNSVLAGYCGKTANRPLSFIRWMPAELAEDIKMFVEREVGKVKVVAMPSKPDVDNDHSTPHETDSDARRARQPLDEDMEEDDGGDES